MQSLNDGTEDPSIFGSCHAFQSEAIITNEKKGPRQSLTKNESSEE